RRVLRAAHPAEARGAARARGERGVRADRWGAVAHDRTAHPGGRRGGRGVPALMRPHSTVAAVDLGASSGRVMLAHVTRAGGRSASSRAEGSLELTEVHRFDNVPVRLNGRLHW